MPRVTTHLALFKACNFTINGFLCLLTSTHQEAKVTNEELRRMRKAKRLTQEQLAKVIGYSRKTVISWENSVHPVAPEAVPAILAACIGAATPAPKRNSKLTADTIRYYGEMRRDFTHADIMKFWNEKNFVPTPEAQAGILEAFPDILETVKG